MKKIFITDEGEMLSQEYLYWVFIRAMKLEGEYNLFQSAIIKKQSELK